jgi:hypothetical protein
MLQGLERRLLQSAMPTVQQTASWRSVAAGSVVEDCDAARAGDSTQASTVVIQALLTYKTVICINCSSE